MIRKAQKNNIHIKTAKNTEIFQTFKKIYNETMDKDNADPYYYFSDFFYKSIEIDLTLPEQKTNEEYMAMISEGIMMGQDAKKKIDEALEGIRKNAYAKIMDAKVLEGIVKINKEKKQ